MEKNQSLHAFVKEELMNQIKSNKYKHGEQFPTEYKLCKEFDVSRTTIRAALQQLTQEGYLVRHQGKGTFVADPKVSQSLTQTVKKYSDQVAMQGKQATTHLISIQVIPANEFLQNILEVSANAPIQRIERTRGANGEPTQYQISYIPWEVAPGITKEHAESSLYTSLKQQFSVRIAKTTENVEITLADERTSNYLKCKRDLPCFYLETIALDTSGRRVEFSRSYFRGDKTNFIIERNYTEEQ
ncbi:GntR family transcriptional regulator [Cytobacillus gottheilii]|uniref:GntR family transcriptional regulator n=1 Tax=Cytobacillus gottheilii TaxID=859144 RepID=A0ABX8F5S0_9BACI|nr:GntR family transcriptional regulator [Cytobacillus gottheilii]QVY59686.1 GntR family transcriptional regulator [Cytobacillus gottheilii]